MYLKSKYLIPVAVVLVAIGYVNRDKLTRAGESGGVKMATVGGAQSESVTIVNVSDGDTVKLSDKRSIRLCGIDSPEIKHGKKPGQPGGEEAKKFLESLVQKSKGRAYLVETDRDRYGRTVGEIFLRIDDAPGGEVNVNSEMVMSGNAYFYRQYSKCPNADRFEVAENIAKKSSAGVWAHPEYELPSDYRKRTK